MCTCCNGRGTVPDIVGELRPCSRCRADAFNLWSADRAPEEMAKALAVRDRVLTDLPKPEPK